MVQDQRNITDRQTDHQHHCPGVISVHLCSQLHFHLNVINLLLASQGASIHTLTWISPRLTDTASPRGIHESLAFLILHSFLLSSFFFRTTASGRFSPRVSSLSLTCLRDIRLSPLSDRQVLAMSDGVICYKCAKHDWSEKCHPRWWRILERWGWRREVHFHSSQVLTDGPSSHFPSFYTTSLSSIMLYRLIYSPLEVGAYHRLRKQAVLWVLDQS